MQHMICSPSNYKFFIMQKWNYTWNTASDWGLKKNQAIRTWENFSNFPDLLTGMTKIWNSRTSRKLNLKIKSLILDWTHLVLAYEGESVSVHASLFCTIFYFSPIRRSNYFNIPLFRFSMKGLNGGQNSESILVTSLRWLVGGYWWVILVLLHQKIFHQIWPAKEKRLKNRKWRKWKKKNLKLKNS